MSSAWIWGMHHEHHEQLEFNQKKSFPLLFQQEARFFTKQKTLLEKSHGLTGICVNHALIRRRTLDTLSRVVTHCGVIGIALLVQRRL